MRRRGRPKNMMKMAISEFRPVEISPPCFSFTRWIHCGKVFNEKDKYFLCFFCVFFCVCVFVLLFFFVAFVFYFIKISKFALPGVMLMYERTSIDRKKDRKYMTPAHSSKNTRSSHIAQYCRFSFVWFDLILYAPSTIFQLKWDGSSWVKPVLS